MGVPLPTLGCCSQHSLPTLGISSLSLSLPEGHFLFLSSPGENTSREIKAKRAKPAATEEQSM